MELYVHSGDETIQSVEPESLQVLVRKRVPALFEAVSKRYGFLVDVRKAK